MDLGKRQMSRGRPRRAPGAGSDRRVADARRLIIGAGWPWSSGWLPVGRGGCIRAWCQTGSRVASCGCCFDHRGDVRILVRGIGEDQALAGSGWVDDQVRDQGRPPGLVHCAQSGAVVAVEVFEEQQVVLPRRVGLQLLNPSVDGAAPVGTGKPDPDQPIGQVAGDVPQARPRCQIRGDTPG